MPGSNYSYQGRIRNIALQERTVAEAEKKLARIERMREEMARQVELEQKRLEEMRRMADDFTAANAAALPQPPLGDSQPESFQSQYDKFTNSSTNTRLTQIGNEGLVINPPKLATGSQAEAEAAGTSGKNEALKQQGNADYFSYFDRDQHFTELTQDPNQPVYVSGYYYSSGQDSGEYEYEIGSTQLPLRVGDMVQAPVHSSGHNDGRFLVGHDRRFIVTDIYTQPKFKPYHDVIW